MDSMRSLNTSLPGTSSTRPEPPETLISAFKAAALSVTQLYKTAAAAEIRARTEGYQDALDELLSYMDRDNIGLGPGDAGKIRKWATDRLSGREQHADSDEDIEQERASSPITQRNQNTTNTIPHSPSHTPPLTSDVIEGLPPITLPPTGDFTFTSQLPYPDTDMQSVEQEIVDQSGNRTNTSPPTQPLHTSAPHGPILIPRSNRHGGRSSGTSRLSTRPAGSVTRVTGQKRKINLGDFFDISSLHHHHRDGTGGAGGNGGGKRGRFV